MSPDFPEDFELEDTSLEDLIWERELERWNEEGEEDYPEDFFFPPGKILRF